MRFRSISILAAATLIAFILIPVQVQADLLLDTGIATNGNSGRPGGDLGFGQGVAVNTTTNLTQLAMFLDAPNGGELKFMIWNGSNTNLLDSDIVSVPSSTTPEWILSDPLSFTLLSGNTYYFGAIQDDNTAVFAPFFLPPVAVSQHGLTTLTTGNSNYGDFITPQFTTTGSAGLPIQLFGTQGTVGEVPEPSSVLFLAGGALAIAGLRQRGDKAPTR